jgi:3-oxoadipate enol-lactonase
MWEPQLPQLEDAFRVLQIDTRGHGGSDAPDGAYDLDMLGDDALGVVDALGIDQVHWVGLSMGGMIGQNLALRAPHRLRSLTLCDTTARVPDEAKAMWDDRINAARDVGMSALSEATMQRWFTPDYLRSDPPAIAPIRRQFEATQAAGFIGCCHAIKALDYLDRLGEVSLPTLIIVGADDPSTTVAASEAMRERISGSEMVVLPSASHLSNVEQPQAFTEALLTFLQRQNG